MDGFNFNVSRVAFSICRGTEWRKQKSEGIILALEFTPRFHGWIPMRNISGGILLLLRNQNVGYAPIENDLICLRLRSVLRSKGVHPRLKVQCDMYSTFDQLRNHHVYMSPGCCMSVFACV